MFFFIPLHLAALALCMYIYARHEADMSPYKIAMVFALPIWVLVIAHGSIASNFDTTSNPIFILLPLYFLAALLGLKLWFFVGWGQAASIGGTFCAYIAAFHILFGNIMVTPEEDELPRTEFLTLADEHLPYKGVKVLTSELSGTLICQITIDRDMVFDEEIPSKPGWFVYCESPGSYWVYSGDLELSHVRVSDEGSAVRNSTKDTNLIKSAPSEVRKRMSKEATKMLVQGKDRLGKKPKKKRKRTGTPPVPEKPPAE